MEEGEGDVRLSQIYGEVHTSTKQPDQRDADHVIVTESTCIV